jgi:hypothetical protein
VPTTSPTLETSRVFGTYTSLSHTQSSCVGAVSEYHFWSYSQPCWQPTARASQAHKFATKGHYWTVECQDIPCLDGNPESSLLRPVRLISLLFIKWCLWNRLTVGVFVCVISVSLCVP